MWGVVNIPAKNAAGKPMAFVLNLTTQAVTVTVPTSAAEAISGQPIAGGSLTLQPLVPAIVEAK
jgi:hypothetical protein